MTVAMAGLTLAGGAERPACTGCGSTRATPILTASDYLSRETFRVVRCAACGLCFVFPRPGEDEIGRYYPLAYYGNRHPFLTRALMRLRERKVRSLVQPGRLLDIGCGHGDFVLFCRERGWVVAGVEQHHAPIMQRKELLHLTVYEADELAALPEASFDVVTLWHVLEHVSDPGATLARVRRLVRPGGLVLIEVPNFGGWQARLGGHHWFHLDVPRHLFHFARASLERLLLRHGFQPERWQTFSLEYDAFGLMQTLLNRVCRHPNHLFQVLSAAPQRQRSAIETAVSIALAGPLLAVALPLSILAAATGQGGVLRVWARPAPRESPAAVSPASPEGDQVAGSGST